MKNDYLIVHKSVLPNSYEDVVMAKELIEIEKISVSDACKKMNISRSTFYKYKDFVYSPSNYYGKKIILSVKVDNNPGSLSAVLDCIAKNSGYIVTIHQDTPIHNYAYITTTVDILQMEISLKELLDKIDEIPIVASVRLVAVE